jgi:hypothetical protein
MKAFLFFLLFTSTFLLAGCATDPEDKAFFEKGWAHPGQNDARMRQN